MLHSHAKFYAFQLREAAVSRFNNSKMILVKNTVLFVLFLFLCPSTDGTGHCSVHCGFEYLSLKPT